MYMLDEAPMKQKWIQWANIEQKQIFASCYDDEERRRQAISLIKKMKENKIHHGRKHLASNKVNALPENMLIYLWLLRYMIHDEHTLKRAIVFFSADKLPFVDEDKRNIFHPDWIKRNIIQPSMDVIDLLTTEASKTHQIFATQCGLSMSFISKRIKESILYAMTSEIIKTIVSNGYPPLLLPDTDDQRQQIVSIQQQVSKMNSEDIYSVEQDLYTIFFQAIPYMIEKNIDSCWEGMLQHFYKSDDFVTDKSWPLKKSEACKKTAAGKPREYNENIDYNPGMHHFNILLPLRKKDESVEFLTISEFFTAIRIGNVPCKQLLLRPLPTNNVQEKTKKRNRPKVQYNENSDENEEEKNDDDEESKVDNEEGETPIKKTAKRTRTSTPKASKTMTVAKTAEKLQLENDMKKKITEMEETFEQLKQSLAENDTVKELFNKFEDKWDIVKLKLDKYKDMK